MSAEISKNEILPTLIVEAGKPRRLPAQRYEFSSVDIKEGALLIIEGGSEGVFHLICSGDFILRGSIVAQGFSSSERSHLIKIPSQTEPLEIVFKNTNKGGRGGNGGTGGVNTGGAGSAGTTEYGGGGGGGGGYRNAKPQPINWKGTDAQENVGGQAGQYCGCAGGDGEERNTWGNGGVIFLNIAGNFDGGGGTVFAGGADGSDGKNGGPPVGSGSGAYTPVNGAGGGGGGAPGNHGGFLIVYVAGTIIDYPQPRLSGGQGGEGGKSVGSNLGTHGQRGQPGKSGRAFWFTKEGLVLS